MQLASIASGCSLLVRTADFHWQRACDYSRLFNVGHRGGVNLTYTPLQKFYERMRGIDEEPVAGEQRGSGQW